MEAAYRFELEEARSEKDRELALANDTIVKLRSKLGGLVNPHARNGSLTGEGDRRTSGVSQSAVTTKIFTSQ